MGGGHGHSHGSGDMEAPEPAIPPIVPDGSYFTHEGYFNMIVAHVILMVMAWLFILPISVMLSISHSRLSTPVHLVFLCTNALGLFFGSIYNNNTPDLYENNAHHKIGWLATWIMSVQALVGLLRAYARNDKQGDEVQDVQYKGMQESHTTDTYRYSRDSGQGTEPNSPRTASCASSGDVEREAAVERTQAEPELEDPEYEKQGLLGNNAVDRYLSRKLRPTSSNRVMRFAGIAYNLVDRTILPLGFITLATGLVTYGGFFKGGMLFTGLAHFIKGGIFFWYGLLTLGRVMGSFSDLGWSWNVKPPASIVGSRRAAVPSAEFVESFLIFVYGSTNVFLEHLGSNDGKWSAGDLEHVSISILFFGGGLCGMLIESRRVRELLNCSLSTTPDAHGFGPSLNAWHAPKTYGSSTNPIPGIVILLLGMMMSSHHQQSMVSTMLHKQWGSLFVGAALARGVTYVLTYISPPTSYLPSRPPSELVVAFCLISGGLVFMGSNSDMVTGMEMYGFDAMFVFTVTMGLTAFLMSWEIVVLTVKGWAVRREQTGSFIRA